MFVKTTKPKTRFQCFNTVSGIEFMGVNLPLDQLVFEEEYSNLMQTQRINVRSRIPDCTVPLDSYVIWYQSVKYSCFITS